MKSKVSFFKEYYFHVIIVGVFVYIVSLSIYAETTSLNHNCLITVEVLKKTNDALYIDVRNKQFFSKIHITGSINIPLDLIKTKNFLKNKKIILVGNGWNERTLTKTCNQLGNKGFKSVKVLAGGVISWFKGQKEHSKRTLISLNSIEFFNNQRGKKFVPVVISNKKRHQIEAILPHAKTVSLKATKKQLLNSFNRLGRGNNPIVIFSHSTSNVDDAIDAYIRKPLRKIYYFEGGFDTYQKVTNLNKMTALSNQKKRLTTKKPVSCAN